MNRIAAFPAVRHGRPKPFLLQNWKNRHFGDRRKQEKKAFVPRILRFRGTPLYCRFKVFDPCQIPALDAYFPDGFLLHLRFRPAVGRVNSDGGGVTVRIMEATFRHDLPRFTAVGPRSPRSRV